MTERIQPAMLPDNGEPVPTYEVRRCAAGGYVICVDGAIHAAASTPNDACRAISAVVMAHFGGQVLLPPTDGTDEADDPPPRVARGARTPAVTTDEPGIGDKLKATASVALALMVFGITSLTGYWRA